jgi:hypothetical protein
LQERLAKLYIGGLAMLVLGLSLSGWLGIGRKLVTQEHGEQTFGVTFALLLMALGAVLAIFSSLLLIYSLLKSRFILSGEHRNEV